MKRRQQLNEFLRKGLIPKPTAEPISSHGILERVNLGLFVNPGAILTAYRHEKAIHEGVSLDEVGLLGKKLGGTFRDDLPLEES